MTFRGPLPKGRRSGGEKDRLRCELKELTLQQHVGKCSEIRLHRLAMRRRLSGKFSLTNMIKRGVFQVRDFPVTQFAHFRNSIACMPHLVPSVFAMLGQKGKSLGSLGSVGMKGRINRQSVSRKKFNLGMGHLPGSQSHTGNSKPEGRAGTTTIINLFQIGKLLASFLQGGIQAFKDKIECIGLIDM